MDRQNRQIQIDPFFDGDGGHSGYAPRPAANIGVAAPGYNDVDQGTLNVMRPSNAGLRGVIVPRATMGGIPMGTRPHETQDVIVNIDPHILGQSSSIRLGDLNASSIQAATMAAREVTPEPTDIQTFRLRGAATMHALANQSRQPMARAAVAPQHAGVRQVVPQPMDQYEQPQFSAAPAPAAPPMQKMARIANPLAAFDQQHQQPQTRPLRNIELRDDPLPVAGPPTVEVVFEMENFGSLSANYHDVIVEEGFVVLIYDTRHKGSVKYFPPVPKGTAPRMAVNVVGTADVYLVQTTGLQFTHESKEFCILMIEDTYELPGG